MDTNQSNVRKPDSASKDESAGRRITIASPIKHSKDITGILRVVKVGSVLHVVDPPADKKLDASSTKAKPETEEKVEAKKRKSDEGESSGVIKKSVIEKNIGAKRSAALPVAQAQAQEAPAAKPDTKVQKQAGPAEAKVEKKGKPIILTSINKLINPHVMQVGFRVPPAPSQRLRFKKIVKKEDIIKKVGK